MPQEYNTRFIRSDGTDMGKVLLTREYLLAVYPQIANQFVTPELWGWGFGVDGQLGTNDIESKSTPVTTFAGGSNWKQVACGRHHTTAIKNDGTLWVWGGNNSLYLTLGTNNLGNFRTPVTTFSGGTNWRQIGCGPYHNAAIKTDGSLWSWGNNSYGKLGINANIVVSTPVTTFAGGLNWKQVSCGFNHSAAVKTDGTLWVWGHNDAGQLGINDNRTAASRSTPVTTFAGGANWKEVSCGSLHTVALKTDGSLWTWGYNPFGQLGNNTTVNRSTPVTTFAGGNNWKQVACGYFHTTAIKTDGTLWGWGANGSGQLGNNDVMNALTPVTTFLGGTNWKQISCGNASAAIKTDGTLWIWGFNNFGQLGINNTTLRLTPVTTFIGGDNWKSVSFNDSATVFAIRSSEEL